MAYSEMEYLVKFIRNYFLTTHLVDNIQRVDPSSLHVSLEHIPIMAHLSEIRGEEGQISISNIKNREKCNQDCTELTPACVFQNVK